MIAFHPARRAMAELRTKWDRQIAHDYMEQGRTAAGRLRWSIKALALAISPMWELFRLASSPRLKTVRDRWLAFKVLTSIRSYRAANTLKQLTRGGHASARNWNRV